MRHHFPLFQSHLDLAHNTWSALVKRGDSVIDATCGNGFDALKLCQLALASDAGNIYCFDVQPQAITSTMQYLSSNLKQEILQRVMIQQRCHSTFPHEIHPESVKLIVYNLGYLPRGNKTLTTMAQTTLQSLKEAQKLLQPGGMISLTFYPGHHTGALEQEVILNYVKGLAPQVWSCCHHIWHNRQDSPSLLFMQKTISCPRESQIPQQHDNKEVDDQHH